MGHDITVCIPTLNGADTIMKALKSVLVQGVNMRVLIADNGSQDGTLEMLKAAVKNGIFGNTDVELFDVGRIEGERRKNIAHVRKFLTNKVETKYLFWLDDDIKLPAFAIKLMMEMVESNPKLGVMGLHYQPFNGHMAVGATIMPTEIAKGLTWEYLPNQPCECNGAIEAIKQRGYEIMYMKKIMALDLNYL